MGNCAFPRDSGSMKWNISTEEWSQFVKRTYTRETIDNRDVDVDEIVANMTCTRKGPNEIVGYKIWLGQDFITFGQLLCNPKTKKAAMEKGNAKTVPGFFDGHDYLFGNKTNVGCASSTRVRIHFAKQDGRTLKVVLSQRSKPPKTINVPIPAGKEEEVRGYVNCWSQYFQPLQYQGRWYRDEDDFRSLWGTLILCDIMCMAFCIGMLMAMDPGMYGGYDGGAGDYGAGDAGEMGGGGMDLMMF
jgi:hypothetical protein